MPATAVVPPNRLVSPSIESTSSGSGLLATLVDLVDLTEAGVRAVAGLREDAVRILAA